MAAQETDWRPEVDELVIVDYVAAPVVRYENGLVCVRFGPVVARLAEGDWGKPTADQLREHRQREHAAEMYEMLSELRSIAFRGADGHNDLETLKECRQLLSKIDGGQDEHSSTEN